MIKKPWERRLKDLAHSLSCCASTYFEPDLFRYNLNQFLTLSRTVTFIIQKNKSEIDGYDEWYPINVIEKWKSDVLMTWAKNSRNTIEKQGDLEMYSDVKATLLFSYIEEQDIEIITKNELIGISVKKLVRLAQKKLPSSVEDAAVIKSERRWVANTLKEFELLHALSLIYSRIYECCKILGEFIGSSIDSDIPTPTSFDSIREEKRHVNYLKLKNFKNGRSSYSSVSYDFNNIPESIKNRVELIGSKKDIVNTDSLVDYYAKFAELTFLEDGYHIPILMFFDNRYKIIDLLSTSFDDQADKFIFWRLAAERAKLINAFGFVWISELWVRNSSLNSKKAIRHMPIVDEKLEITGIDSENYKKSVSWKILRKDEKSKPTLSKSEGVNLYDGQFFYMRPILKAIGGDISKLNN